MGAPQANKMVLSMAAFRLLSVIEAAMEIVGLSTAVKRLQVRTHLSLLVHLPERTAALSPLTLSHPSCIRWKLVTC